MGSENQSFTKQSGVRFAKSMVPDPTRHHLMGYASFRYEGQAKEKGNHLFFSQPVPYSEDVEFRWGQVGSENQSFIKQVGVCFAKSMVPDPTRHHLMGYASLGWAGKASEKGNICPFLKPISHLREALSKYGEFDSAWRQNRPKMLSLSRMENGRP